MHFFLNISYCHKDLSDAPGSKELHFARKRSNGRTKTESVKNRTKCKDDFFFRILGHLESENLKLIKVRQNPDAYYQKFADPDHIL